MGTMNVGMARYGLEVVDAMAIHVATRCYDEGGDKWELDVFLCPQSPEDEAKTPTEPTMPRVNLDAAVLERAGTVGCSGEDLQAHPPVAKLNHALTADPGRRETSVGGYHGELAKYPGSPPPSTSAPELAELLALCAAEVASTAPRRAHEDPIIDQLRSLFRPDRL